MKCSLLTLSTYVDGELPVDRRAEVDAHLVGCSRCSVGAATLRDERGRIGQLVRVRVAPPSALLMLEQLGITGASGEPAASAPPRSSTPAPQPVADDAPWRSTGRSPALPWTPRRPDPVPPPEAPVPPLIEEMSVPPVAPDVQPDLPFGSARADHGRQRGAAAPPVPPASPEVEASAMHPSPAPVAVDAAFPGVDAHPEDAEIPRGGWEMDLPPPIEPVDFEPMSGPCLPLAEQRSAPEPAPPPPAAAPPPLSAPIRQAGTGPAMLWSRVRDAVGVRMALARGGSDIDESVHIVSGNSPRRAATPPQLPAPGRDYDADPVAEPVVATPPQPASVELAGLSGASRTAPGRQRVEALAAAPAPVEPVPPPPVWSMDDDDRAETDPSSWNAFGSAFYGDADDRGPVAPAPDRPRPLGRHSRAVTRHERGVDERLRHGLVTGAGLAGAAAAALATALRSAVASGRQGRLDRRIIAAVAAVAIVFLTALIVGHGPASPATSATGRTSPGAAPAHSSAPAASAPATSSSAATAPATAPLPATETFGAGGTGFEVRDLRYGKQPGYVRIVFDIGPVSSSSGTSPTVTTSFTSPTTLLVTLAGTLPAGSTGTPPAGSVISAVTLVSSGSSRSVYRFTLSRAVTVSGLFLSGANPPLRFVLDLH